MARRDKAIKRLLEKVGPVVDQMAADLRDDQDFFNYAMLVVCGVINRNPCADGHPPLMALTDKEFHTVCVLATLALRNVADKWAEQEVSDG